LLTANQPRSQTPSCKRPGGRERERERGRERERETKIKIEGNRNRDKDGCRDRGRQGQRDNLTDLDIHTDNALSGQSGTS